MWPQLTGTDMSGSGIISNNFGIPSLQPHQFQNSMSCIQHQLEPAWPALSGYQPGASGHSCQSTFDVHASLGTPEQRHQHVQPQQQQQPQPQPSNDWRTPTSAQTQLHLHPDFDPELPSLEEGLAEQDPDAHALFAGSELQSFDKALHEMSCSTGDSPIDIICAGMPLSRSTATPQSGNLRPPIAAARLRLPELPSLNNCRDLQVLPTPK